MSDTQLVVSPAELIIQTVQKTGNVTDLKELLAIQKDWEANEARKAFHKSMAEFKANPLVITKDKENKQYKSMYTTLGNLVNTANPELSKFGFSSSWDIHQNETISVTCKITHALGHTEQTTASAPADTSGSKNPIQQIKSTITYLKSVTFESITGLASTDANLDDDGNSQSLPTITDAQLHQLRDVIIAKEMKEADLIKYLKVESLEDLLARDYMKALQAINAFKKG